MSRWDGTRKGREPRDMSYTARCMDCDVYAVHERGPGTPLVIRHLPDCPNRRPKEPEE